MPNQAMSGLPTTPYMQGSGEHPDFTNTVPFQTVRHVTRHRGPKLTKFRPLSHVTGRIVEIVLRALTGPREQRAVARPNCAEFQASVTGKRP